ncbi:hemerythrin domain-containing protein [Rhodoferax sp.]|uniref:hemerythrin domain-containing protein n=1 Tax=Rhodoferax sp. TaxID=50421 RepID=UPI00374CE73D
MALLEWSDALSLDLPCMDDTHREFVDLLACVMEAPDAQLLRAWRQLIAHTEVHFGQEDRWMQATRFATVNCHSMQHKVVLEVMREGLVQGEAGYLQRVRDMAAELGPWFLQHAQSMDAALALHVRSVGFDPLTGVVASPAALPATLIQGCGGSSCSDLPRMASELTHA